MAQEIGSAYVTIIPSTKGAARQIEGDIGGAVTDGTKKGGKSFLGSVGVWAKRAGVAGAAITAGLAIKGGISRLMQIDDAKAKLAGLGHSTGSISKIMDSALGAVKGTAFGLGEAATAAASAVAAGIKPGAELQKYLTLIGDAATIGGTSFNEMGAIINKVTARGKAGMENLNQLTERGIPIMQWLADEYGVSGEALSKMVSQGKVDAATFRKVIEKNIGGAAQASGKTFRGAWANLQASMGRIAASFMEPFFEAAKPAMAALTKMMGPLEAMAKNAGAAIGKMLTFLVENKEVVLAVAGAFLAFKVAVPIIGAVTGAFQALSAVIAGIKLVAAIGGIAALANPVGLAVAAIAALVGGLVWAYKNFEGFRNIVNTVFKTVGKIVSTVFNGIWSVIQKVATWFQSEIMPIFKEAWDEISSAFEDAWKEIGPIVKVMQAALAVAFKWIADNIGPVLSKLTPIIKVQLTIWKTVFTSVFRAIAIAVKISATILGAAIRGIAAVIRVVAAVVGPVVRGIATVISTVFNWIRSYFTTLFAVYRTIFQTAFTAIRTVVTTVFNQVRSVVQTVMSAIGSRIRAGVNVARAAFGLIRGVISSVVGYFQGLVSGIRAKMSAAIGVVRAVPARIKGVFSGAIGWLSNIGSQIMQGLARGISGAWSIVSNAVRSIIAKIPGPIRKMMGIESPAKKMMPLGRYITAGLAVGIGQGQKGLENQLKKITNAINKALNTEKISKAQANRMKAMVASTKNSLAALTKNYAEHKAKLDSLVEARDRMATKIGEGLQGEASFNSLFDSRTESSPALTFAQVSAHITGIASRVRTFANKLTQLVKMGVPAALIEEIGGLGSANGIQVANALLSGTKGQIKSLASNYTSMVNTTNSTGAAIAEEFYKVGIAAQQGMMAGLLESKNIATAASRLAKSLVKAVRKQLGIKSPSRVFGDEVGAYLVPGIEQAVQKDIPGFQARLADGLALSDSAVGAGSQAFSPTIIVKIGERELEQISQEQAVGVFNYVAGLQSNRQVAV